MKLIILKNHLKAGLDAVGRATSTNLNLPVLGNVLIKTLNNQIKISATNLELAVTKTVYGKIIEDGSITVPFGVLSNIVGNLASERINIEVKQRVLTIKTDNYEAKISSIDESEFPIVPKIKEDKEFLEINSSVIKNGLEKVMVAAGFSDLRPEISGILISAEPSVLKMAATDTFRLAETKIPGAQIKNSFKQGFKVIVPLKTVQELVKIVSNDEMVTIYLENNQILFKTQDVEIVSRLIDGNFPDYEAIIPKEIGIEISVNREEFINAIKLIGSFASKVSDVKLKTRDKKIVEVYSNDSSLGENNYLMPAKISGGDVELTFNWRYLLDGVKVGAGDQVLMGINGDAKPALIKTPEDTSYFYILMPVKQ